MRQSTVGTLCISVIMATLGACGRTTPSPTPASALPEPAPSAASDMPGMGHLPMTLADWSKGAMPYDGLGDFHRKVTTVSEDAQKYFDQGMRLLWAFNHDESTRSFAKAVQLDPQCAMCYWGVALT